MTTIGLMTTDQALTATEQPKIASGDQNSVMLKVEFDSKWSAYTKSAVFFTDETKDIYEIAMASGECIIPHEVLAEAGSIYIGIRGVDAEDNRVKTSTLVKYKIEQGAPAGDGTSVPPTADVYQQLLDMVVAVREDFNAGAIPALQEQNKKAGFMFWVGTKAEYEAQMATLDENTFCVITDDTTEEKLLADIEANKWVDLGTAPIQVDLQQFDRFMLEYNYNGTGSLYKRTILFDHVIRKPEILEVDAYAHFSARIDGANVDRDYKLHFTGNNGVYNVEATHMDVGGSTTNIQKFDKIYGFKTPIKGE